MTEDAQLLQQIANGDEKALASFYRRYEARLFRFIQSKINDAFEAADILNEVFLVVWDKAGSFEGGSKVSTWLFSIAHFKAVDRLRKHRPTVSDDVLAEMEDDSPQVLTCMIGVEQDRQVRDCVERLKPDHRAVMELTFFEEMSYREIARVVSCPENTVKARMSHARQAMKKCLSRLLGDLTP